MVINDGCNFFSLQACKLAIRESIEADIRRERELRDNPDMELVWSILCVLHVSHQHLVLDQIL